MKGRQLATPVVAAILQTACSAAEITTIDGLSLLAQPTSDR